MIHMLSWFDLKEGRTEEELMSCIERMSGYLIEQDLLVDCSDLGRRVENTPMDTDEERKEKYFITMRFKDRAQMDASYAFLETNGHVADSAHPSLFSMFDGCYFICWEV